VESKDERTFSLGTGSTRSPSSLTHLPTRLRPPSLRRQGLPTLTVRELFDFTVDPSINESNLDQALERLMEIASRWSFGFMRPHTHLYTHTCTHTHTLTHTHTRMLVDLRPQPSDRGPV
jgi:hypothetical protein